MPRAYTGHIRSSISRAFLGQLDVEAAAVARACGAPDQLVPLDPVDQPAEPAVGEQHALGQLDLAQAPLGRLAQRREHVIPGQRRQIGLVEVAR